MGAAALGTKLGRYQIVKHLASGGMAEVLLARASGIEGFTRHVVIKRIRPSQANDASFVQMFLNEARLAAQLHHHHIVQVHDIGQEGNEYFFAMEYVHGEDLRRLLTHLARHKQKLPLEHVVTIITAAATALHHAHEQLGPDRKPLGIVHRDVTPANILVGYDGSVKVADFGIAKAAARTAEVTQAGTLKGKASYMSPEQCTGSATLDRRSDVFALGIVLYELATTRRLFKAENDFLTMSAIVSGKVPSPREQRPDMPIALEAIIVKALAQDPAKRFQTADEMRIALDAFATHAQLRTTTSGLGAFMKQQFGEKLEPWLVETPDDAATPTVDFDGSASGLAPAPQQSVDNLDIPPAVTVTSDAPILRARTKAISVAPPMKKPLPPVTPVVAPIPAKPRAMTAQIPVRDEAAALATDKPKFSRRDTPVPIAPQPSRQRTITVQIPAASQAAAAPQSKSSASESSGVPLPGVAKYEDSGATSVTGVPNDVDSSWDTSQSMPVVRAASTVAAAPKSTSAAPATSATKPTSAAPATSATKPTATSTASTAATKPAATNTAKPAATKPAETKPATASTASKPASASTASKPASASTTSTAATKAAASTSAATNMSTTATTSTTITASTTKPTVPTTTPSLAASAAAESKPTASRTMTAPFGSPVRTTPTDGAVTAPTKGGAAGSATAVSGTATPAKGVGVPTNAGGVGATSAGSATAQRADTPGKGVAATTTAPRSETPAKGVGATTTAPRSETPAKGVGATTTAPRSDTPAKGIGAATGSSGATSVGGAGATSVGGAGATSAGSATAARAATPAKGIGAAATRSETPAKGVGAAATRSETPAKGVATPLASEAATAKGIGAAATRSETPAKGTATPLASEAATASSDAPLATRIPTSAKTPSGGWSPSKLLTPAAAPPATHVPASSKTPSGGWSPAKLLTPVDAPPATNVPTSSKTPSGGWAPAKLLDTPLAPILPDTSSGVVIDDASDEESAPTRVDDPAPSASTVAAIAASIDIEDSPSTVTAVAYDEPMSTYSANGDEGASTINARPIRVPTENGWENPVAAADASADVDFEDSGTRESAEALPPPPAEHGGAFGSGGANDDDVTGVDMPFGGRAQSNVSTIFGDPAGAMTTYPPNTWPTGSRLVQTPPGFVAKLLASPKRIAIIAGTAISLCVIVYAIAFRGGSKPAPAPAQHEEPPQPVVQQPAPVVEPAGSAVDVVGTGSATPPPAPVEEPLPPPPPPAPPVTRPKTVVKKPAVTTKRVSTVKKPTTTTKKPAAPKPKKPTWDPNSLFPTKRK